MNVASGSRPNGSRTVALGVAGLAIGPVLWFITLYVGAFLVSAWTDEVAPARIVGVLAELLVALTLVVVAVRAPRFRPLVVGAAISFAAVTLMYWAS